MCWAWGWDKVLVLLPRKGVTFGGAHLAGSLGGSREEAWEQGWGSEVSSSVGSGGPAVGSPWLSGACSVGSISKVGSGGSTQRGEQESKDDKAGLRATPHGHWGPDSRHQPD